MSDDLAMKISKLLIQERPLLLKADVRASAEVSRVLATLLGLQLSGVLLSKGQDYYVACLKSLMLTIDAEAQAGARRASEIAQNEPQTAH